MEVSKGADPTNRTAAIATVSNLAFAIASPARASPIYQRISSGIVKPRPNNDSDVSLDLTIAGLETLKQASEVIPVAGVGLKVTCGIMILILHVVKRCKANRAGWEKLAEVIRKKNESITMLLELYSKSPAGYPSAERHANEYQRVLNSVAEDIKKETQREAEASQGLERYWSRTWTTGRDAVLANINAEKIASYQEQIQSITFDVIEKTVVHQALANAQAFDDIKAILTERPRSKAPTVILKPRPRIVEDFVGRNDILTSMCKTHFIKGESPSRRDGPVITVLTGMGGSGKTQIAVKFASLFEEQFPAVPIFFLDASSEASLQADLDILLRSQSDSYDNALVWLANGIKNWLLVMDNADDPSLKFSRFLPRAAHGHIIITTRDMTRKTLAPRTTHVVDVLPMEDSITLLLTSSASEDNELNRSFAMNIAEELGRLPLALAHAAAYVLINNCLDTFLETYRESRNQFFRSMPDLAQDYHHSVERTIEMSFRRLSPGVQVMLQLFAHLDARSVPRSVIERAAHSNFLHIPQRSELPTHPGTAQLAEVLCNVFCPTGEWKALDFDRMIGECLNYSLLQLSTIDGEKFYIMHPLVQGFLHSLSNSVHNCSAPQLVIRLLASAITIGRRYEHYAFNRLLAPHVRLVSLEDVMEPGDHYGFGSVLMEAGNILATAHLQRCLDTWKSLLDDNSHITLDAMFLLSSSYQSFGRDLDALPLQEEVLAKRRELLGPDHLDTLVAMHDLGMSYGEIGRAKEALSLREEVLAKRRKLLGPDHLDTLASMNSLARSYQSYGRKTEALSLREEVLAKRRRLLGPDHLDTMVAIRDLANSYMAIGKLDEALLLREETLAKYNEALGPDHLDTLRAMHNLASSYEAAGRVKEALELQEEMLIKWRKLFGPDHPDALHAMHGLANYYEHFGRVKETLALREEVFDKRTKLLGPEHRDTLDAAHNLLSSYQSLSMPEELRTLARTTLPSYEKFYGFNHGDTVWVRSLLE